MERPEGSPNGRSYLLPLGLAVTALALVYGRFLWQARHAVHAAEAAAVSGAPAGHEEAVRLYLDALRSYAPGSPFESRALDGLAKLARTARAEGKREDERRAWEAVRLGLLGTRSLYLPYPGRFAEAERRLAELDASHPVRAVRPMGPRLAATLLALAGFAIWVGATVLLIRRGVRASRPAPTTAGSNPSGTKPARVATPAAVLLIARLFLPAMFVVGFALFVTGLRLG